MFQLIYELRKNWRGRTDEGSIRGPRGPKKVIINQSVLVPGDAKELPQQKMSMDQTEIKGASLMVFERIKILFDRIRI